ncbi:hypothetical protein [Bergeyella zoohelcum]|nr:hypothetical protein [Bergeyella zoohelcum]
MIHNDLENEKFDWEYEKLFYSIEEYKNRDRERKEAFFNVKDIYDLINEEDNKIVMLDDEKFDKINRKIYTDDNKLQNRNIGEYINMWNIWKKYRLNPFKKYHRKNKISFEGREYSPMIIIDPLNINETEIYLDFLSEWVYEKLLDVEEKNFYIHTKEDVNNIRDKEYKNIDEITSDIDNIFRDVQYIIGNAGLKISPTLGHYIEKSCIEGENVKISFFDIDSSIIENIWSIAIGRGVLYGHCEALKELKRKKTKFIFDIGRENNYKFTLKSTKSFYSRYAEKDLEIFYQRLNKNGYIVEEDKKNEDNSKNFINIFKGEDLNKIKPIIWKKKSNNWIAIFSLIRLLVEADIKSQESEFKNIFIRCFCFEGKEEGIEMKEHYEKSRKEPFDKVFVDKRIDKDIESLLF